MADLDDITLVNDLVTGKESAFRTIFERFYEKLFVSCFGIIRNTQEAEDIVVVTFNKLFERHKHFESLAQVQAWLFLAARNNCIDYLRTRRRNLDRHDKYRKVVFVDAGSQSAQDELDAMLLEKIVELVGELPPQSQQVIRMRYLEGMKYKEIADRLHISPRTVENLLRFALDRLRRRLGDQKMVLFLALLGPFIS